MHFFRKIDAIFAIIMANSNIIINFKYSFWNKAKSVIDVSCNFLYENFPYSFFVKLFKFSHNNKKMKETSMFKVLAIFLTPFFFLALTPPANSQTQVCDISYSFDSYVNGEYVQKINVEFKNMLYVRRPLLIYCNAEGGYPKPFFCNSQSCNTNCSYASAGKYEIKVVLPGICTELCKTNITIVKGVEFPEKSVDGFRLMDSCPNNYLYVANSGNNTVVVIDTNTDEIIKTITVGRDPRGVRCNKNTGEVWITNWGSGTIDIIDSKTNSKITSEGIKSCINPWGVDFSPDGKRAFVACWGGDSNDWCSMVQGALQNTFNELFSQASIDANFNFKVSEGSYVAAFRSNNPKQSASGAVVVFDTASKKLLRKIPIASTVNGGPWGTKKCRDFIFITNDGTDSVSVIDPNTFSVIGTIKVGEVPWDASCDEVRGKLYVANGGAQDEIQRDFWYNRKGEASLSVIDVEKVKRGRFSEEARIPLGFGAEFEPWSVAVDEKTGNVFISDLYASGGSIHVLNAKMESSGEISSFNLKSSMREWSEGNFCRGIAFVNGKVYVGCTGGGRKISTKGEIYRYVGEKEEPGSIPVLKAEDLSLIKEINPTSVQTKPKVELPLKKGWNLISSNSEIKFEALKSKCPSINVLWRFSNNKYEISDRINSLEGYWIYASEDCVFEPQQAGVQNTRMLEAGWNLVSANSAKSWNEIKGNCVFDLTNKLYKYETGKGYVEVSPEEKLDPFRGYWVNLKNACTIKG
jgi:YVTN family beta-propeller protein